MSNLPPKPKKKKEDLEKEQQLKDSLKIDLQKESKLYGLKYLEPQSQKFLQFITEGGVNTLLGSLDIENVKNTFFIKIYETGAISNVNEKAFKLLVNIGFKLLSHFKQKKENDLFTIEIVLNYIASHILKGIELKDHDIDFSNDEQITAYIEANFESIKTIESKIQAGFYNNLFIEFENEEIKLFKPDNEDTYDFSDLNKTEAYNWLNDYVAILDRPLNNNEILNEALSSIDTLFLKLKHAFQYYLNYPPNILIINETKIVDQPIIFEERAVVTKFPLRSIENCLFKMKNDPIDPTMFDNLQPMESEEDVIEEEDEWAGLDDQDIEAINRQLEEYRGVKEVELAGKIEEANNKKNNRKRR